MQDFLGTLNINNNGKPNNSRDMKVQFDEEQEEERAPPSIKFSTPQTYQSPVPIMVTNKFNIRRLSLTYVLHRIEPSYHGY